MRIEKYFLLRGINDRYFRKRFYLKFFRRIRFRFFFGFYVYLKNLFLSINKRDLRNFFRDIDLINE